ncbi:FliO/MopB family protein [Isoptericola rhizosphaerae]|uniref:FliO/MopB family protein n=1 Tax=Isoptericola rhizosphaerae TaxID=3377837 RepID=UPI003839DB98
MDLVTVLRVAFSLVVVFGLLWLSYRIAGKGSRSTAKASGAQLAVVARQGLTGKSAAVLLQAGGTQYLLGVTESSVTLIDRQDAPAVDAAVTETASSAVPAEPLFDDAVTAAQRWLVRTRVAPQQDVVDVPGDDTHDTPREADVAIPRPALADALRTFLAPATWRRSALTVWAGRR